LLRQKEASYTELALKLKRYKSPATDQIPPEMFQATEKTILSEIQKLINFILNREELTQQ
jgi:hypothetical protein